MIDKLTVNCVVIRLMSRGQLWYSRVERRPEIWECLSEDVQTAPKLMWKWDNLAPVFKLLLLLGLLILY